MVSSLGHANPNSAPSIFVAFFDPVALIPAVGESDSAPPAERLAPTAEGSGAASSSGSTVLGVAFESLVQLALRPRDRQTGDRDRLAQEGISAVLEMEEPRTMCW